MYREFLSFIWDLIHIYISYVRSHVKARNSLHEGVGFHALICNPLTPMPQTPLWFCWPSSFVCPWGCSYCTVRGFRASSALFVLQETGELKQAVETALSWEHKSGPPGWPFSYSICGKSSWKVYCSAGRSLCPIYSQDSKNRFNSNMDQLPNHSIWQKHMQHV